MLKKFFVIPLMLVLLFILSGCFGSKIHITGTVVDQHNNRVEGIKVVCQGSTDITDSNGRFIISVKNVEYPTNLTITFEGEDLGFETSQKSVLIYPDEDKEMGSVVIKRVKAMIYGEITYQLQSLNTAKVTANEEKIDLPDRPEKPYPDNEIIVKFKDGITTQSLNTLTEEKGLEILEKFPQNNILALKTAGDLEETIKYLKTRPDVEFAEPNYYVYPLSITSPNDPYYNAQWNLQAINIENAWGIETGSRDVKVAIFRYWDL